MHMKEERHIPAPRERVWHALHDIEVLKAAMPGCERFEKIGQDQYEALIMAEVGPMKSKFKIDVSLSEVDPPRGYVISGEGEGEDGAAGFARGSARINLEEQQGSTVLEYSVEAMVGGELAQLGGRLIDAKAKEMADEFFGNLTNIVAGDLIDSEAAADLAPESEPEAASPGVMGWFYAAAAVLVLVVLYTYLA